MVDDSDVDKFIQNLMSHLKPGALTIYHRRKIVNKMLDNIVASDFYHQHKCRSLVRSVLKLHKKAKRRCWGRCRLGNEHCLLHIVIKVCYEWKLDDPVLVGLMIQQIFNCEESLEKLIAGVLMGSSKGAQILDGWQCDYEANDQGIDALTFLLDNATRARLTFRSNGSGIFRFQDVPLLSYFSPVYLAAVRGCSRALLLLLRYGAKPSHSCWANLLQSPIDFPDQINCMRYLFRSVTTIPQKGIVIHPSLNGIISAGIIFQPRCLKHLCRCSIRYWFYEMWLLPGQVQKLNLPPYLKDYLDLLGD